MLMNRVYPLTFALHSVTSEASQALAGEASHSVSAVGVGGTVIQVQSTLIYVCGYGSVAVWQCGSVAVWQCGSVAVWQYGSVAVWQCGSVAVWQCGSVAVWQCGSVAVCSTGIHM